MDIKIRCSRFPKNVLNSRCRHFWSWGFHLQGSRRPTPALSNRASEALPRPPSGKHVQPDAHRARESRASAHLSSVTTDCSCGCPAQHPELGAAAAPDMPGHPAGESRLPFPPGAARISSMSSVGGVQLIHCSAKPNICASFPAAGKPSHFPRKYLFGQRCLPVVRKMALAKSLKRQLGEPFRAPEPWEERLREKGSQGTFLETQPCVRHWTKHLLNFF